MPFGRPWETDLPEGTRFPATSVTISGAGGSCEECADHQGTFDISGGGSADDGLAGIDLPPFHPNGNCRYGVNYDAPQGYMTRDDLTLVLQEFATWNQYYKDHTRPGLWDDIAIDLGKIGLGKYRDVQGNEDISFDILPNVGKSCGTRAGELQTLFENYLRAKGFRGWDVSIDMFPIDFWAIHGWVAFRYTFINESGVLESGEEWYDPWLLPTLEQIENLFR